MTFNKQKPRRPQPKAQRGLRRGRYRTPRVECLERRELLAGDLAITELLASNSTSLLDIDGDTSDWIEIHNPSAESVDLAGWTLSDDPADLGKWELPPLTMVPDQYLVVFASGKDRSADGFRLIRDLNAAADATFAIDLPDGEYALRVTMGDADRTRDLMAVHAQGTLIDTFTTAAHEYAVRAAMVDVSSATGGQLLVRIEDQGGTTTRAVINALTVTPTAGGQGVQIDFGDATSPIEPGYVGVTATDVYDAAVGYGWLTDSVVADQDRGLTKDEPHTNFKLAAQGGYLALVSPAGTVVSEFGPAGTYYPKQFVDMSYGVAAGEVRYFLNPTPEAPNGAGQLGFTQQPVFSAEHGFYSEPLSVELSTPTRDATIRYTTDGTEPTSIYGTIYSDSITVSATTTLRAAAFGPDLLPSPVETQTYLFLADVAQQWPSAQPADFPLGSVNGQTLNYGMDPDIVGNPIWRSQLQAALTAVPTFSIVTDADNLFDRQKGIYVNASRHGQTWERPASVELINPDGSPGFQIDAGLRIRGGFSRSGGNPKHAFRLFFRSQYGAARLEYPLFEQEGVDQFESVDLRTTQNYSWAFQGDRRNTFLRDIFSRDVQRDMGQPYTRGRYYHLYINGQYWGLYQTEERPESAYAASYFGGDSDDYDVVKSAGSSGGYQVEATDGNLDAYRRLHTASRSGFADNSNYFRVQGMNPDGSPNPNYERLLDVNNLIDYMIITYYTGDKDGPGSRFTAPRPNNFFGIYNRENPDGFKWFEHDSEHSLDVGQSNMVTPLVTDHSGFNEANQSNFNPHWLHEKLTDNAEYRQRFADRVQQHFANGGALSNRRALAIIDQHAAEIETAMIAESARWGDAKRATPYTQADWANAVASIRRWLPTRIDRVLSQLRTVGWFPQVDAPTPTPPGGFVPVSSQVTLTAGNDTIYYTINGDDPRQLGGAVSPNALVYDQPIIVQQSQRIRARALRNGQWSALSETVHAVETPLRITELNYNPAAPTPAELAIDPTLNNEQFEFVELVNTSDRTVDLAGLQFTDGIEFAFADDALQTLAPGALALVVSDRAAFEIRYGNGLPVAGEFAAGRLRNGGEHLQLEDQLGIVVQEFTYDDNDPWPTRADGTGSSLEVVATTGDYAAPANWRASSQFGGTPGMPAAAEVSDIVINELLSRSGPGAPDQIELLNTTTKPIDVSNWYLSDTADDPLKSSLPPGTTIGPRQYLVLNADQLGLALSGTVGGQLWLVAAQGDGQPIRFADQVQFGATDPGVSLGRWPNGDATAELFPMSDISFGTGNPGAATGPVVVAEIAFRPRIDPIVAEDFSGGSAGRFVPIEGAWDVVSGTYQAVPGEEADGDAIATLTTSQSLPGRLAFSAIFNIPSTSDSRKNGTLIFDYRSPQDFKFLHLAATADVWRLGTRDANGWNFLAEVNNPIETDTDMQVTVEIAGSVATARLGTTLILRYDFETPLNLGQLALGSKRGTVRFDDVKLEYLGGSQEFEFVELAAAADVPVDVGGWQFQGAINWAFAPGTTIGPQETLVLVRFDPNDTARADVFRQAYEIDSSVRLEGPFQGDLGDTGATVRLLKPVTPSALDEGLILVDRITYTDSDPWPLSPAGGGDSLVRARAEAFGNAATSWYPATPSPGKTQYVVAGDMNLDGVVNGSDVAGFVQALADPSGYWAEFGRAAAVAGDMDGDGDVDYDDIGLFVARVRGEAVVDDGNFRHV